ncbi:hypothetical protein DFH07DRAFT_971439 [Mycena maculata]|uniref:Uncharacterized protein n=1 Tax=Mycena maculata TaxID=230809 RepID=A0AAD7HM33_9AGAR|nr:hypothetical protein DFH07DRAFT_971439 [Mycena maculata]
MKIMGAFPTDVHQGFMGRWANPEKYCAALEEVSKHHACRMKDGEPQPKEVAAGGLDRIFVNPAVSEVMNTGKLKEWTRFHEIADSVMEPFVKKIPKVKWVRYENASHLSMWEVRERNPKQHG